MKKRSNLIIIVLIIIILFLGTLVSVNAQTIINSSPNYWTLMMDNGDQAGIDPFYGYDYEKASENNILYGYGVEIRDNVVFSHGFGLIKKEQGDFLLKDFKTLPIFIQNTMDEEVLVQWHRYAFIMAAKEVREISDIYITHDLVVEIKVSYLVGDDDLLEVNDKYVATKDRQRVMIKI